MEQHNQQLTKLLTAKNGFILHVTPRRKPKEVTLAKTTGPHVIYGISYGHPEPMPVTLSN
ncbi:MAG TPA: hypothetical protein VNN62_26435 [Methylomirabilota bacterium]|jgi:hypothetical protein|nr:hypothetical protein [Methylomirabilota bacterium]